VDEEMSAVWTITAGPRKPPETNPTFVTQLAALLPSLEAPVRAFLGKIDMADEVRQALADPNAILEELRQEGIRVPSRKAIDQAIRDMVAEPPREMLEQEIREEAHHAGYEIARFVVNALLLYKEGADAVHVCETTFVVPVALVEALLRPGPTAPLFDSLRASVALEDDALRSLLVTLLDRIHDRLPVELPQGLALHSTRSHDRGGCCGGHGHGEPRPCDRCPAILPDCARLVSHCVLDHWLPTLEFP
jgi:hypothetical protein